MLLHMLTGMVCVLTRYSVCLHMAFVTHTLSCLQPGHRPYSLRITNIIPNDKTLTRVIYFLAAGLNTGSTRKPLGAGFIPLVQPCPDPAPSMEI